MLSSTRAMTCSNLWCSWVRRAVGFDSRALTTWRREGGGEETQQRWLFINCGTFMHLQIWPPAWATQGNVINMDRSALASSPAYKHASTPQRSFALHIFTKPTSALLFTPNSCHHVSGIYGLLAVECNQAEQAVLGRENRQSGAIHSVLWIRV